MLLIIESLSAQVLFQYPHHAKDGESNKAKVMQLVTPIVLGQRIFREELHFEVTEVRIGASTLLVSSHLDRYTLVVKGHSRASSELKAFRKASYDLINLLCGPCWLHLKTNSSCAERLRNCIDSMRKYLLEEPHFALGMASRPIQVFNASVGSNACDDNVWVLVRKEASLTNPINRRDKLPVSLNPSDLVILSYANVSSMKGLLLYARERGAQSYELFTMKITSLDRPTESLIILEKMHSTPIEALLTIGLAVLDIAFQASKRCNENTATAVMPQALLRRLATLKEEASLHGKSLAAHILHFLQTFEHNQSPLILQHKLQTLANLVHLSMMKLTHPDTAVTSIPNSTIRWMQRRLLMNEVFIRYKEPDELANNRLANYLQRHPFSLAWVLIEPSSRSIWRSSNATTEAEKTFLWSLYQEIWSRPHQPTERSWSVNQNISIYRYKWSVSQEESSKETITWYNKLMSSMQTSQIDDHCNFVLYILCMSENNEK